MKKPKLLKVTRTESFVKMKVETDRNFDKIKANNPEEPGKDETKNVVNLREFEETAHEAPLPAFDLAMQALGAVVAKLMDCEPEWRDDITIVSLALTYSKANVRTGVITFAKKLSATGSPHPMKTPAFQIDDGKTAAEGKKQIHAKHTDLVIDFIKQAQKYAAGDRSQQMLQFDSKDGDDDGANEDDKTDTLPFEDGKADAK